MRDLFLGNIKPFVFGRLPLCRLSLSLIWQLNFSYHGEMLHQAFCRAPSNRTSLQILLQLLDCTNLVASLQTTMLHTQPRDLDILFGHLFQSSLQKMLLFTVFALKRSKLSLFSSACFLSSSNFATAASSCLRISATRDRHSGEHDFTSRCLLDEFSLISAKGLVWKNQRIL